MPEANESRVLPCVVQLGFAGSRRLFDLPDGSQELLESLLRQVQEFLIVRLRSLPKELGLSENQFCCAISQIAIGADTLFTRACQSLDIPQRVFLPEHRDAYLGAVGSDGTADFTCEDREIATTLLSSPHVIQEQVVSDAPDRRARFKDANREIFRESDFVVCLLRADAEGKPGGTQDLLQLVETHRIPTLEIRVAMKDEQPFFEESWHAREHFAVPTLPKALAALTFATSDEEALPERWQFCGVAKAHVNASARRYSELFSWGALAVIATHILATISATIALAGNGTHPAEPSAPIALWMRTAGWRTDPAFVRLSRAVWLHHTSPSRMWALARLLAEINRSVASIGRLHLHLGYLFRLRLPDDLVPLLRTLNILQVRSTRAFRNEPWMEVRDAYLKRRLLDPNPKIGQIAYYRDRCVAEKGWLKAANAAFAVCSLLAIAATAVELLTVLRWLRIPDAWHSLCASSLGTLAVFLPVLAVVHFRGPQPKTMKRRVHTYGQMVSFLEIQCKRFEQANSEREFGQLLEEAETRLLGENADWYLRRTFAGVM